MTPIDIQVSRSKVSVEGQAYSLYVGEGGHECFTNIYIFFSFQFEYHSRCVIHKSLKAFFWGLIALNFIFLP